MRVHVIDCRSERRTQIIQWLREMGHEPSEAPTFIRNVDPTPDIVLMHVGGKQGKDSVNQALNRYGGSVWTIGYTGSASVAAVAPQHTRYQQFPPDVPGDSFPVEFRNTIVRVLTALVDEVNLSPERFKQIVSEFDPALEARLKALVLKLKDGIIDDETLDVLQRDVLGPDRFEANRRIFEPDEQRTAQLRDSREERLKDTKELRGLFWQVE